MGLDVHMTTKSLSLSPEMLMPRLGDSLVHKRHIRANPQKIAWALGQLLDNAVKFTFSGGRVVPGVQCETTNLVIISVTDTGIGIPPNRIGEIFEPFHQLGASTTRRYSGTGIGLSLVCQIVETHGSMLEVISADGKGSICKFPVLAIAEEKAENG